MKIGLKIGERGPVQKFLDTYSVSYLNHHGMRARYIHSQESWVDRICVGMAIKTKSGEVNTGFDTVVTYLGNDMWTTEKGGHLR